MNWFDYLISHTYFWPYAFGIGLMCVGYSLVLLNEHEDYEEYEATDIKYIDPERDEKVTSGDLAYFVGCIMTFVGMVLLFITIIVHLGGY